MYYKRECNLKELHINECPDRRTVCVAMTIKSNFNDTFTIIFDNVAKSSDIVTKSKKLALNSKLVLKISGPDQVEGISFDGELTNMSFDKFGVANYNFVKFDENFDAKNTICIDTSNQEFIDNMNYNEHCYFSLIL